jgi:ketosteroid isomerase-like protein
MKQNKLFTSIILIILLLLSGKNFAQQWSPEQKDVWSGVQKYWEVFSRGEVKSDMTYYDESYMGWEFSSKVPQNKENTSKWIEYMLRNSSIVLYTLTPVVIWVKGDFAYVDYYYSMITKDNETGKKENSEGTWTDILMKKDGKWLLIGDRGGSSSK